MSPDGGDYATSKYLKWHRLLSISLVAALFVFHAAAFGIGMSVRRFAAFVLPLILIWFSDSLAAWGCADSGGWFSSSRGDTYVRICAWLILFLLGSLRIAAVLSV
jgi:hypothetical protein